MTEFNITGLVKSWKTGNYNALAGFILKNANIDDKKYYEIPLIKKYDYEIISSFFYNYEGNIFCKEGEEYAGFLYKREEYYSAFGTYPLNNAEEVMKAREEVYTRGCVETVVGEKMIGIVEGTIEEENLKK